MCQRPELASVQQLEQRHESCEKALPAPAGMRRVCTREEEDKPVSE
jgi:hypothetical protein